MGVPCHRIGASIFLGAVLSAAIAKAGNNNAVVPGKLEMEPATLACLGVKWIVTGDANSDSRVELMFRKSGQKAWRRGMGLFRVESAAVPEQERPGPMETLLAGGVIGLEEGTEYELHLALKDPDGGGTVRILTDRTKKAPRAYPGGRVLHAIPGEGGGTGTAADPFRGLAAADEAVRPGDTVLVHRGVYRGEWTVRRDGEPGKPIAWRGAGDGEAVLDGKGDAQAIPERTISASDQ